MTIDRKLLGNTDNAGQQLTVSEFWLPGEVSAGTNGWIKKQLGVSKFLVVNPLTSAEGIVKLQNTSLTGAGQARIEVKPTGNGSGAALTVRYRIKSGALVNAGSGYAVNDTIVVPGNVTTGLITVNTVDGSGGILTFTVTSKGSTTTIPTDPISQVSTSGSGVNATFDLTWEINTVTVTAGGSNYNNANIVFTGGSPNATGTVTLTSGAVTSVAINTRGTYENTGNASINTFGTTQYLKSLQYRRAITFDGNSFIWDKNETADQTGEANVDFS